MASRSAGAAVPRRPRRRRELLAALACSLLAIAIGGCAELPASGKPQALEGNSGQAPGFIQPLPPPGPNADWSARDVIEGFLHASASFYLDGNAAKEYLAPDVQWHPTVVIVVGAINEGASELPSELTRTGAAKVESFDVKATQLATLTSSGQYINSSVTTGTYEFTLAKYNDVWRIQSIRQTSPNSRIKPDTMLLLDQADFQQVFQPRDLYFFSEPTSPDLETDLVPDPVFAPIQGSTLSLERRLVLGLLSAGNSATESWLSDETLNAFPAGTRLLGVALGSNLTATVDLGGTAATVPVPQQQQMYEQLTKTLQSAPQVAASVQLEFNGQPFRYRAASSPVPGVGTATEPLYFAGNGNGVVYMKRPGKNPAAVSGPAQFWADAGVTAVAVRPDDGLEPQMAVATSSAPGCSVAIGETGLKSRKYRTFVLSKRGGPCTTLSWDGYGDLWAAAGPEIWVVRPGQLPVSVSLPDGLSGTAPGVLALKVAPDSTRVALLVHSTSGDRLYLAAASYSGSPGGGVSLGSVDPVNPIGPGGTDELTDPIALTWYSPTSLDVLDGPVTAPELYEVPLDGAQGQLIGSVPDGTDAISSNGSPSIVLGTTAGNLFSMSAQNGEYHSTNHGIWPAYAG
jgi:Lipoprotein LpqB beta-propeller domain/Sporulation and spore germination